jgi:hypothetical protein
MGTMRFSAESFSSLILWLCCARLGNHQKEAELVCLLVIGMHVDTHRRIILHAAACTPGTTASYESYIHEPNVGFNGERTITWDFGVKLSPQWSTFSASDRWTWHYTTKPIWWHTISGLSVLNPLPRDLAHPVSDSLAKTQVVQPTWNFRPLFNGTRRHASTPQRSPRNRGSTCDSGIDTTEAGKIFSLIRNREKKQVSYSPGRDYNVEWCVSNYYALTVISTGDPILRSSRHMPSRWWTAGFI